VLGAWKPYEDVIRQAVQAHLAVGWKIEYRGRGGETYLRGSSGRGARIRMCPSRWRGSHLTFPLVILSNASDNQIQHTT